MTDFIVNVSAKSYTSGDHSPSECHREAPNILTFKFAFIKTFTTYAEISLQIYIAKKDIIMDYNLCKEIYILLHRVDCLST